MIEVTSNARNTKTDMWMPSLTSHTRRISEMFQAGAVEVRVTYPDGSYTKFRKAETQ